MDNQKEEETGWLFNPFEIAFCGYSDSGKTSVITTIIHDMSAEYKIGFVKNDVHGFEMDHEGKDTYLARSSGASSIRISDKVHFAEIHSNSSNLIRQEVSFLDADLLFIEGYKNSSVPKFIFIDREQKILKEFHQSQWKNIIGFIGYTKRGPKDLSGYSYYHRDDIPGIQEKILDQISKKIENIPLFGLILAGGKSTRLKKEKGTLNYHGISQIEYCYKLLSKVCQKVFISNRKEQSTGPPYKNFPQIHDQFLDLGPLGGILTAMHLHPKAAWLVLGCDLPFVDLEILTRLVHERDPLKMATAYIQSTNGFPEPLCTIYEPKIRPRLFQCLGLGYDYPLKALMNAEIKTIVLEDGNKLKNVNTLEEYEEALKALKIRGSLKT